MAYSKTYSSLDIFKYGKFSKSRNGIQIQELLYN